jgi:hypothetical protein
MVLRLEIWAKGKAVTFHAMNTYTGYRGVGPLVPNFDTGGVVKITPQRLYFRDKNLVNME